MKQHLSYDYIPSTHPSAHLYRVTSTVKSLPQEQVLFQENLKLDTYCIQCAKGRGEQASNQLHADSRVTLSTSALGTILQMTENMQTYTQNVHLHKNQKREAALLCSGAGDGGQGAARLAASCSCGLTGSDGSTAGAHTEGEIQVTTQLSPSLSSTQQPHTPLSWPGHSHGAVGEQKVLGHERVPAALVNEGQVVGNVSS